MKRVIQVVFISGLLLIGCKTAYQPVAVSKSHESQESESLSNYPTTEFADTIASLFQKDSSEFNLGQEIFLFYKQQHFKPVWTSKEQAQKAILWLKSSEDHGLNPYNYQWKSLDSLGNIIFGPNQKDAYQTAIFDVQLTTEVLRLSHHVMLGKHNPLTYEPTWNYPKKEQKLSDSLLIETLKSQSLDAFEKELEPNNPNYQLLKKGLKKWMQITSCQNNEPEMRYPGKPLHKGDTSETIRLLKIKLAGLNLYNDSINEIFDASLLIAVKKFQVMHGLAADGVVGPKTFEFLDWKANHYVDVIKVNMERLRWMPYGIPDTLIWVNIPDYRLRLLLHRQLNYTTRVVVGKSKYATPVFQSQLEYLVFNPCWTVPNSIAVKSILPKLQKDTNYLENHQMFVTLNGIEQDADSIDFKAYNATNFPYKLFQRTGDENALGAVKFMFPNDFSIYLHDTPQQYLFARDIRSYSHGCIRVQHAMDFADLILHQLDENTKPLEDYLAKGYPVKAYLKKTIPIQITYFTCLPHPKTGELRFYYDVYSKDLRLILDLEK